MVLNDDVQLCVDGGPARTTSTAYDEFGRPVRVTDAEGRRVRGPLGLGTDFESVREYVPDDDVRRIIRFHLDYVRVRKNVGSGSGTDTDRTRRQQAFIGSMIKKVFTGGIMARPDRLIRFMNATEPRTCSLPPLMPVGDLLQQM